ncbi:hypothetical protein AB4Z38_07820 [Arthrobacter sp. 2RAF6]|uniref:hypothetical protein n=1 Tax=Arthrobacter sp. 2RAF6 TaxID=3233002 RepID=UPI003F8F704A
MTFTAEAPHRLEDIAVRFSPDGAPLAVRYGGNIWAVDPDAATAHWFGRRSWWDGSGSAAIDGGDLPSVENWRLHARLSSNSALLTFHLQRSPGSPDWFLADITDAS